jgi:hypothetical protein
MTKFKFAEEFSFSEASIFSKAAKEQLESTAKT